jgi:hypothetical protein
MTHRGIHPSSLIVFGLIPPPDGNLAIDAPPRAKTLAKESKWPHFYSPPASTVALAKSADSDDFLD